MIDNYQVIVSNNYPIPIIIGIAVYDLFRTKKAENKTMLAKMARTA